jgi:aminoglycoside phosphotransferase family enzyme
VTLDDLLRDARETRETHVSVVLLGDRDVYKLKKPVDLGFLDFRTVEQRRAACEAEMRLNARLAPDVYLGVVPILRGGEVVDWAVHMRRLPDDVRADVMLGEGRLTPEHLDDVAERLAAFHDGSSLAPEAFGGPASVRANVEENFAQTRNALASLLRPDEVAELLGWQTSFVQTRWSLFEQRVEAGRVRDGHGDLRLEHVYFTSPALRIIDCIEFSDRFRYADVCADVAFLSMDLASHGRVDLAERFVARYARASNDFDLYALIDFYESYRAFVRAKVLPCPC